MARTFRRNAAFDDIRNDFDRRDRFAFRKASRAHKLHTRAEVVEAEPSDYAMREPGNRKARKDFDGAGRW